MSLLILDLFLIHNEIISAYINESALHKGSEYTIGYIVCENDQLYIIHYALYTNTHFNNGIRSALNIHNVPYSQVKQCSIGSNAV